MLLFMKLPFLRRKVPIQLISLYRLIQTWGPSWKRFIASLRRTLLILFYILLAARLKPQKLLLITYAAGSQNFG